jgi:hypothetical protein
MGRCTASCWSTFGSSWKNSDNFVSHPNANLCCAVRSEQMFQSRRFPSVF